MIVDNNGQFATQQGRHGSTGRVPPAESADQDPEEAAKVPVTCVSIQTEQRGA